MESWVYIYIYRFIYQYFFIESVYVYIEGGMWGKEKIRTSCMKMPVVIHTGDRDGFERLIWNLEQ